MKTYQYLEINPAKGIAFTFVYIAIVVIIASLIFGGFGGLADAVNNFGSAKGLGLLAGIIVITPVFFLIKLIYPKVHIITENSQLTVSRKREQDKLILFTDITTITLNAEKINTLTLYGSAGEVILSIHPFNNHHLPEQIAKDIISEEAFQKTVERKKLFNTAYEAITYKR